MIKFEEGLHKYTSIDGSNINWTSVTSLVSKLKNKFDAKSQALKSSKNKKSKWYGLTPEEILQAWDNEKNRSTELGTWYHNLRERELLSHSTITDKNFLCSIKKPLFENDYKIAPNQKLENNCIYPEHFVYLKSAGICGQSDIVKVINHTLHIEDFKSNKTIDIESYKNWEGQHQMMLKPLAHLQDCHINHYALQLSLYMYMILKHNPNLKEGTLKIHHIIFEEESRDKYDYPIYKKDTDGNFIVKEIVPYTLPYLKKECISLLSYLKQQ